MSDPIELEVRERGCCQIVELALTDDDAVGAAAVFKSVADPARAQILATLAATEQPACVCDLIGALGLSQATVSHHIAKLRRAEFIIAQKRGLWSYYSINDELPELQKRVLGALLASKEPLVA